MRDQKIITDHGHSVSNPFEKFALLTTGTNEQIMHFVNYIKAGNLASQQFAIKKKRSSAWVA